MFCLLTPNYYNNQKKSTHSLPNKHLEGSSEFLETIYTHHSLAEGDYYGHLGRIEFLNQWKPTGRIEFLNQWKPTEAQGSIQFPKWLEQVLPSMNWLRWELWLQITGPLKKRTPIRSQKIRAVSSVKPSIRAIFQITSLLWPVRCLNVWFTVKNGPWP